MTDATDSQPTTTPDRASFTTALNTARDQLTNAARIIADPVIDLVGAIGRAVLAHLLPERRIRVKTRMIKRSNSKYQARGPNIDRHSYKGTIAIDIITNPC